MVSCHSVSVLGWVLGPLGEVGDSGTPWTTALGLSGIGGGSDQESQAHLGAPSGPGPFIRPTGRLALQSRFKQTTHLISWNPFHGGPFLS